MTVWCALSGEPLPLQQVRDLASIASFDEFYGWYRQELAHAVDLGIRGMNVLDGCVCRARGPIPSSPRPWRAACKPGAT